MGTVQSAMPVEYPDYSDFYLVKGARALVLTHKAVRRDHTIQGTSVQMYQFKQTISLES